MTQNTGAVTRAPMRFIGASRLVGDYAQGRVDSSREQSYVITYVIVAIVSTVLSMGSTIVVEGLLGLLSFAVASGSNTSRFFHKFSAVAVASLIPAIGAGFLFGFGAGLSAALPFFAVIGLPFVLAGTVGTLAIFVYRIVLAAKVCKADKREERLVQLAQAAVIPQTGAHPGQPPQPEAPQRGSTDYLDELERMHVLMQQGALTEAEFQAHKDRILASPSSTSRCAAAAAPEPAAAVAVATATVAEPELSDAEIMPEHIQLMLGRRR